MLTQRSPWCVQMDRRLVDSARLKKSLESPELDATAPSECVMRIGTDLFLIFQRRMTRPGRAPQPVGGRSPFRYLTLPTACPAPASRRNWETAASISLKGALMGGSAPLQAAALTPKGLLIRCAVLGLMLNRSATLRTLLHLSIRVSNSGAPAEAFTLSPGRPASWFRVPVGAEKDRRPKRGFARGRLSGLASSA